MSRGRRVRQDPPGSGWGTLRPLTRSVVASQSRHRVLALLWTDIRATQGLWSLPRLRQQPPTGGVSEEAKTGLHPFLPAGGGQRGALRAEGHGLARWPWSLFPARQLSGAAGRTWSAHTEGCAQASPPASRVLEGTLGTRHLKCLSDLLPPCRRLLWVGVRLPQDRGFK